MTDPQPADNLPPFRTISECVREHARRDPRHLALCDDTSRIDYGQLDAWMDRVAGALQQGGLRPGDAVAICANASVRYAAAFLGALRAGAAVAPIAPSVTREQFGAMLRDARASICLLDATALNLLPAAAQAPTYVALDELAPGTPFESWLAPPDVRPQPVAVAPGDPFNIIYSSGTTGTPKGIVQPHGMRWAHVSRGQRYGYGPASTTLLATPLYSNTTLVVFFPSIAYGGCVWLMAKFDARRYLELAQRCRATHSMLVPVQYQRIMALPDFDAFDLSSFQAKFCTSAPFSATLKAEVLKRWPGGLTEFYGMTEGGASCILDAHQHPDKLHTVGRPAAVSEIRLIDEDGRELAPEAQAAGAAGEVVGHSAGMMSGYHGQSAMTREVEWFDASGKRFIRTGDVGRFDADGFLILLDRRKDMIISGGFNIYPSDLEAELRQHPAVLDVAVVGAPSQTWGETPVAWVVRRAGAGADEATLRDWINARVGKTQRVVALHFIAELPRSAIGKVLKRELRERLAATRSTAA
jgi:long-chain acyl-CoA synthetase